MSCSFRTQISHDIFLLLMSMNCSNISVNIVYQSLVVFSRVVNSCSRSSCLPTFQGQSVHSTLLFPSFYPSLLRSRFASQFCFHACFYHRLVTIQGQRSQSILLLSLQLEMRSKTLILFLSYFLVCCVYFLLNGCGFRLVFLSDCFLSSLERQVYTSNLHIPGKFIHAFLQFYHCLLNSTFVRLFISIAVMLHAYPQKLFPKL